VTIANGLFCCTAGVPDYGSAPFRTSQVNSSLNAALNELLDTLNLEHEEGIHEND
jgi:hypothetical protein